MITKLKYIFSFTSLVGALTFASPSALQSQVFHSVRTLLSSHFRDSASVSYVRVRPTGATRSRIERRLGRALAGDQYTFFVAQTSDRVDGYALFDEERGQHEMISFGTFFDAQGRVTRVEVMAYREPYGDGIRAARFREQLVGRTADSGFRVGRDIDSISGSTISARSMCIAVERATVLLEEMVLSGAAARPTAR